ncbi:MAG: sulfatase-like hydrolase/transferase [Bacteroidales bacterium]|nr:sulfatase-like hydrolase/transferase [Bacteroidales bacterium]
MRFSILLIVLLMCGLLSVAQQKNQPNVIFILTDDQGYGDFSGMGNPYVKTPAMDQLKNEGTFFSNFHVSAVCAPTRASLMTGRYNYRTGVSGVNRGKVNMYADEHTMAEYFKEAGYNTGLFGKWHLGYNYPMRAIDQGFDVAYMWDEMQRFRTDPVMEENGVNKTYKGEFLTDVIFDKAEAYLEEQAQNDTPFFAYIATFLPHTHHDGSQVPDEYMERFNAYDELSWHTRQCYAMIEKVDERIDLLLKKLDKLGLEDNTMIIFTTDNGPAECYPGVNRDCQLRYRCGLRGMKGSPYEGGIRVPLFMKWPGHFDSDLEVDEFTAHVDILPTLMDVIGHPLNDDKVIDGRSLYPFLLKEEVDWEPDFFYHLHMPDMAIMENKWNRGTILLGDYKLVEGKELFNIAEDPFELNNLAEVMPEKLQLMRKAYVERLELYLSERGLKRQPNILGSDKQQLVNLLYFEKIPEESGWPVEVIKKGPYTLIIDDIQHADIKPGSQFILKAMGKEWRIPINRDQNVLRLSNIRLPKGEYFLQLLIDDDTFPKTHKSWTPEQGRYHRLEWGHRRVTIELK